MIEDFHFASFEWLPGLLGRFSWIKSFFDSSIEKSFGCMLHVHECAQARGLGETPLGVERGVVTGGWRGRLLQVA